MLGNFIGFLKAKDYRNKSSPGCRIPATPGMTVHDRPF
jgi:hypothetical protein